VGALHDGSVDGQAGGGVLVLVDDVVVEDEVEELWRSIWYWYSDMRFVLL
jgi:heme oxygenase